MSKSVAVEQFDAAAGRWTTRYIITNMPEDRVYQASASDEGKVEVRELVTGTVEEFIEILEVENG